MNRRSLLTTLGTTALATPLTQTDFDPTYHYINNLFKDYTTELVHPANRDDVYVSYLKQPDTDLLLQYRYHPTPFETEVNGEKQAYKRIIDVDKHDPYHWSIFVAEPHSHRHAHQILSDIRTKGLQYAEQHYTTVQEQ